MTDNTQELDEILSKLARDTTLADRTADIATTPRAVNDANEAYQWALGDAKQALTDWHNKQVEEVLDRLESERDSHDADTGCSDELGYIPLSAIEAERNKLKESSNDRDS